MMYVYVGGCECVGVCVKSYCGWSEVKYLSVDVCIYRTSPLKNVFFYCYADVDVNNIQSRKLVIFFTFFFYSV